MLHSDATTWHIWLILFLAFGAICTAATFGLRYWPNVIVILGDLVAKL